MMKCENDDEWLVVAKVRKWMEIVIKMLEKCGKIAKNGENVA